MWPNHPIRRKLVFCALILSAGLMAYWPLAHNGFVNYDDPDYVTANPIVRRGITGKGLTWAFSSPHAANYIPMTWLSHMIDCQFFGLNPGAHHLVSLAIHLLTALVLFLILETTTGRPILSLLVALLFAVHPAHVESVAWAAERKDVLSGFFFILAIAAYVAYVDRPGLGRFSGVLLLFLAGLLCKPMVVSLPFVMMLLDIWPLGRSSLARPARQDHSDIPRRRSWRFLMLEKTPMVMIAIAAGVMTIIAQHSAGAMDGGGNSIPLSGRITGALVAYARYLGECFWPVNLCVFYPRQTWSGAQIALSSGLLILITLAALSVRRRNPYVLVGWLFFIGMLVPVIGIVQVGSQSMADRYLYLPMIGLSIMVIWAAADAMKARLVMTHWRAGVAMACTLGAAVCILATRAQARVWRSDLSLYANCLRVAPDNAFVEENLGAALAQRGQIADALPHLRRAVEIQPELSDAHGGYGHALRLAGKFAGAERQLRIGLKINPRDPRLHAELGLAYFDQHKWSEAADELKRALEARPDLAEANLKLGLALMACGRSSQAIEPLIDAVTLMPQSPQAMVALSWMLATHPDSRLRNGAEAVKLAARADKLTHSSSIDVLDALAAAQAENQQFDQASQTAARAADLAQKAGATTRAAALVARAKQYAQHQPLRDPSLASVDTDP